MITKLELMQAASQALDKHVDDWWNLEELFDPVTGDPVVCKAPMSGAIGRFIVERISSYYDGELEYLVKDLTSMAAELEAVAWGLSKLDLPSGDEEDAA